MTANRMSGHVTFAMVAIGQTFDFVDPENPQLVSFWDRCEKTGALSYRSLSTNHKFRVETKKCAVFNLGIRPAQ